MPCIPLPRLQFGGIESHAHEVEKDFPLNDLGSLLAHDFATLRWRHFGSDPDITGKGGILPGKTIIDLSRINAADDSLLTGDPHRPIDHFCNPKKVWIPENESLVVANHVLGTIEQFAFREDSRIVDRVLSYEARKSVGGETLSLIHI